MSLIRTYDDNNRLHSFSGKPSWDDGVDQKWHKHGKIHRASGPACVMESGIEIWYHNGKKHREGGPAEYNRYGHGVCIHYHYGEIHNLDGPAFYGSGHCEYWIDGIQYYEDDFLIEVECYKEEKAKKVKHYDGIVNDIFTDVNELGIEDIYLGLEI
jgi:hypothetical protein